MSKHTPGPWAAVIDRNEEHEGVPLVRFTIYTEATYPPDSVNNLNIASGYGGLSENFARYGEGPANARLIAAAPEMLDALLMAQDVLADHSNLMLRQFIDRAIAKARGEL